MTRRVLFFLVTGALCSSGLIAQWKRTRQRREWEKAFSAYSEARRRALGPDRMSDEEAIEYVARVIRQSREGQKWERLSRRAAAALPLKQTSSDLLPAG